MFKFKTFKKIEIFLAILLIFICIIFRLIDHLPNFTPVAAMALFAGTYLSRRLSLFLPILAIFLSDLFIGFYQPALMLVVYGSFLLLVVLGWWLKDNKKWLNILAGSILAGIIFFAFTNFAVWLFTPWYAKSLQGLIACYTLALPFFRNTLAGNLFYTFILFGSYQAATLLIRKKIIYEIKS